MDFSNRTYGTIPSLANVNAFSSTGTSVTGGYKVVVPDALYDQWIAATNWVKIQDHIVKASEFTE